MLLKYLQKEFLFNCKARNLSPKTIKWYDKQIGYLLEFLEKDYKAVHAEQVTTRMVKAFMTMMEEAGRNPQYVYDLLKAHKVFFKYLHAANYLPTHVACKISNMQQPKVLIRTFTENNIRDMLKFYSGRDFLSIRNRAILSMFFDTGIRLSELVELMPDQIKENYIVIHGKGGKDRVVPISPYLAKVLMQHDVIHESYFAYHTVPDKNVFVSRSGRRLNPEGIGKIVKRAGEAASIAPDVRVSPHTCRHTFAHLQLKNGLDLYSPRGCWVMEAFRLRSGTWKELEVMRYCYLRQRQAY